MHTIFESCFPLALGTAPFGTGIPRNTAFAILGAFVDAGGNLVDTAAVYGMGVSEQTLGEWMRLRQSRDRVVISTKGGHPSLPDWARRITEADIRADMEDSLRFLGTDHVDIYFLHRDDESKPVEDIMPILDTLVREGKTRLIGASNWTVARINEANAFARANGMAEFSVSQIFWNGAVINKDGVSDKTLVVIKSKDAEKIETGRKKVGAMLGDFVEVGCGSVLNPGTVIGRNSSVYPLSSVRGVLPSDSIYKADGNIVLRK